VSLLSGRGVTFTSGAYTVPPHKPHFGKYYVGVGGRMIRAVVLLSSLNTCVYSPIRRGIALISQIRNLSCEELGPYAGPMLPCREEPRTSRNLDELDRTGGGHWHAFSHW
jgi:hypothetical protein